jgi:phenylpropionate dioxygenase-like ring-hydroxylating dioxygenase large terminal subunit
MGDLSSAFESISSADVDPDADWSLPGWIYTDPEFAALEMDGSSARRGRSSATKAISLPGAWRTLEYLGENVIVVRGEDGPSAPSTNLCRHRAMRLVEGHAGCAKAGLPLSRLDL